jgi:hypothetical protein
LPTSPSPKTTCATWSSTEDRLLTLLAVSAKLVLENLVLHVQLLRRHGLPVGANVEALLDRLRKNNG